MPGPVKKKPAPKKKVAVKKKAEKPPGDTVHAKKIMGSGKDAGDFPIVALGSSAGGLKSLEMFLSCVPEKSGICFVVISHTDPDRTSLLPDILKRSSTIPVKDIESGMAPRQNAVYLPPSNRDVILEQGKFHLKERPKRTALHMPIDLFLESLAKACNERAGCVILSGTGTDGTHGLRLIKEAGWVVLAEDEVSARHYGMPKSAINTGLVEGEKESDRILLAIEDITDRSPLQKEVK